MNGISALIRNMGITRWSILKSLQPKMEKLYTVSLYNVPLKNFVS